MNIINSIRNISGSVWRAISTVDNDPRQFCRSCNQYLNGNHQSNNGICNCCAATQWAQKTPFVITHKDLDEVSANSHLPSKTINCPGCLKFITRTVYKNDTLEKCDCGQILCFGCGAPLTHSVPYWICNGSLKDCVQRSFTNYIPDDLYA